MMLKEIINMEIDNMVGKYGLARVISDDTLLDEITLSVYHCESVVETVWQIDSLVVDEVYARSRGSLKDRLLFYEMG